MSFLSRMFQRQQRRDSCPTPAVVPERPNLPVRPPEKCADPVVVPPATFVAPPEAPPPTNVVLTLDDVVMTNAEATLSCADLGGGDVGDSITIAANTIERRLFWSDIPGLLQMQRNHIAQLTPETVLALTEEGVSSSTVQTTLRLVPSQADAFLSLAANLRAEIQEAVENDARSRLRCVWVNAEVTATCPVGCAATGETGYAISAGVKSSVTIPAGTFESQVSQEDADAQATAAANAALVCLYGNDAITVNCVDDLGKVEAVPSDITSQAVAAGRLRRGEFTSIAGRYYRETKELANEAARNEALSKLDCFYVNQQRVVSCDDDELTEGATLNPRSSAEGVPGNPITVPVGSVISTISTADANAQADALAATLLECVFYNEKLTIYCAPSEIDGVQLSSEDIGRFVEVPAGMFSSTSVEAANELAATLTRLQMQCRYCNAYIPPACYPATYTPAEGEGIPPEAVTSAWPTNVVLGLAAGSYCAEDPAQVLNLAQAAAYQRPLQVEQGCIYQNDEMWFGCLPALPGAPELPLGGYHSPTYAAEDLLPHPLFPDLEFKDKLSTKATPSPALGAASYIKIAANSYPVNSQDVPDGTDPKVYANEQARLYGLSLLNCMFSNPERTWTCENAWSPPKFVQSGREGVTPPGDNDSPVISTLIPAARYSSNVSFADAVEQARQAAIGELNCYYTNDEVRVSCWEGHVTPGSLPEFRGDLGAPGYERLYGTGKVNFLQATNSQVYDNILTLQDWQLGSLAKPVVIPRGTIVSDVSKEAAHEQAVLMALSMLECAAAARDAALVCNDPLLIRCGGVIEPNPAAPYREGGGAPNTSKWEYVETTVTDASGTRTEVRLHMGDGRNYMIGNDGSGWETKDLGCSSDPVGGCGGSGIQVPPCIAQAATKEEANLIAYNLFRQQLSCFGTDSAPAVGAGGAADALGCAFPFRVRALGNDRYEMCPGVVYANAAPMSMKSIGARTFTATSDPAYIVLQVLVNMSMQNGWLTNFSLGDANVALFNTAPAAATPQPSGYIFSYLVATIAGGSVSQSLNGDVVLCGLQSPVAGYSGKALMRPC